MRWCRASASRGLSTPRAGRRPRTPACRPARPPPRANVRRAARLGPARRSAHRPAPRGPRSPPRSPGPPRRGPSARAGGGRAGRRERTRAQNPPRWAGLRRPVSCRAVSSSPADLGLLRDGLLGGTAMVVAGPGALGAAVGARAAALGAAVTGREVDPAGDEVAFEGAADVLVWDGSDPAADADAVRAALDGAWLAIRPVATAAMIASGGGRIVAARACAGRRARRRGPRRAREPRAHAVGRVGALPRPPGGRPARRGDQPGRGGRAGRVPGLARRRVLLGLRVRAGRRSASVGASRAGSRGGRRRCAARARAGRRRGPRT